MQPGRRAVLGAALGASGLAAGCAAVQTSTLRAATPAGLARRAELTGTPFFPQTAYHCGPAALATVLTASGRAVTPAELVAQVFLPARTGTLQVELVGGARRQGRVPTRIPPTLEAVLREVQAGTPVLVLQNLGLSWVPLWHYAVVVGHDLDDSLLLLRSGSTERLALSMATFEHTWARAGSWAITVLPPGRWPQTATDTAVVEAAVGFERAAAPQDAVHTYRSALQRLHGQLTLMIGLGNALHAAGELAAAAQAFRDATQAHPRSAPAWLNLGSTLLDLGDAAGALAAAQRVLALPEAGHAVLAQDLLQRADAALRAQVSTPR